MDPLLHADALVVATQGRRIPYTFDTGPGLNLLYNERENNATALALTLAGRRRPRKGRVWLEGSSRGLFHEVALAGATVIDSLERQVPAREVVREQIAWAQPFYRLVGRDVARHPLVSPWLEPLGLDVDFATPVGELAALDRLRLRILLALIARRNARLLVVDDVDQLRSLTLRDALLANLKALAAGLPVVATTVNPDPAGIADHILDIRPASTTSNTDTTALEGE